MWGVVGIGVAGRARVKALRQDPRAEVILGYRGDTSSVGLPAAGSLYELLGNVEAVAICSPDRSHPDLVEAALGADCHVVCEYPLAGNATEARRLLELAGDRQKVLHVEHIELLGGAALWLRDRCAGRTLRGGSVRFNGGPRPDAWSVVHANLARLHRLADAVGLPRGFRVENNERDWLRATFVYTGGGVQVEFQHAEGLRRSTEIVLELDDGTLMQSNRTVLEDGVPVALPQPGGLFVADQLAATARVLDGAPPYVTDERIIDVLQLADELID